MKQLLPDRIVRLETQPLSENDRLLLINKRNKQLKFLLFAYVPLVLILVVVLMNGLSIINRDRFPY